MAGWTQKDLVVWHDGNNDVGGTDPVNPTGPQGDGYHDTEFWKTGVSPADAAWVDRRCVPHPVECFAQKVSLTGAWREIPRLTYILALGYKNSRFGPFAEQVRGEDGWHYHELPCGHDVMIDMPDELAALLEQAAP